MPATHLVPRGLSEASELIRSLDVQLEPRQPVRIVLLIGRGHRLPHTEPAFVQQLDDPGGGHLIEARAPRTVKLIALEDGQADVVDHVRGVLIRRTSWEVRTTALTPAPRCSTLAGYCSYLLRVT